MIFIDANVFVAYYNERDFHHSRAVAVMKDITLGVYGPAFTSDYIFDESVTVAFIRSKDKDRAVALGDALLHSTIKMLKVNGHVFREAWKLFGRNMFGLSFTDRTNLVFMRLFHIERIATFDGAFEKFGVSVVP